jgi:hypothetical protein
MRYILLSLLLVACAKDDYPSPFSATAKPYEAKLGLGRGLWAPLFVPVAVGDTSTQTYFGALKPFPQDGKAVAKKPEELLTDEQIRTKEAELTKIRDDQRKRLQ